MALVMTEFGAEATEPGPADVKQTYAFQTRYLERNLDIIDRLGFMGGAIYWTSREFAVKPRWDGGAQPLVRDSIHNKALIAYDGTPKPAFEVARAAFRATPLYRDDPAAVARAELAECTPLALRTLLVLGVLGFVAALLVLDAALPARHLALPPARRRRSSSCAPPQRRLSEPREHPDRNILR